MNYLSFFSDDVDELHVNVAALNNSDSSLEVHRGTYQRKGSVPAHVGNNLFPSSFSLPKRNIYRKITFICHQL